MTTEPSTMGDAALRPPSDGPRMTLRVSRDGGRTWGREKKFYDRNLEVSPPSYVDPPCECPLHRGRGKTP